MHEKLNKDLWLFVHLFINKSTYFCLPAMSLVCVGCYAYTVLREVWDANILQVGSETSQFAMDRADLYLLYYNNY